MKRRIVVMCSSCFKPFTRTIMVPDQWTGKGYYGGGHTTECLECRFPGSEPK